MAKAFGLAVREEGGSKETNVACQASRLFWSLVRQMPLQEFTTLLKCGKDVEKVYVFDHISRSAYIPKDVPWPIEYLLGFHSPKCVL